MDGKTASSVEGARDRSAVAGQDAHLTIGLLTHDLGSQGVWAGIDVAQRRGVNTIVFVGRELCSPVGFEAQANVIYELVSADRLDGLVIDGALASAVGIEGFRVFCERFRPMPIVTTWLALEGVPSVLVEGYGGMHDVVTHLVQTHGHRRVAFIRGPEGHPEADERYRAYVDVLVEHDVQLEPALVAPGGFDRPDGIAAMDLLLAEGAAFSAVVACTDYAAFGALEVLRRRGVRVPEDVAVVGFDDDPASWCARPSLTTVRQPYDEQNRRAAEMLLALLAGEEVPERLVLPAEAVIRQSCGCHDPLVTRSAAEATGEQEEALAAALTARRDEMISEVVEAARVPSLGEVSSRVGGLLDAFAAEVGDDSTRGTFLNGLKEGLREVAEAGGELTEWHDVMSALRRNLLPYLGGEALQRAENVWQQARVLIGEAARQAQAYRQIQREQQFESLRQISASLLTVSDMAELMDLLVDGVSHLDIAGVYVSLYEDSQPHVYLQPGPEWSRLILAYDEDGRVELDAERARFPSHELVPQGLLPRGRAFHMIVEPLYFRDSQLGFALFEGGQSEGGVCAALSRQVASALQGVSLTQKVARRAVQLQTAAEVSRAASSVLDVTALLQRVVDLMRERFDLYYVGLFLVGNDGSSNPSAWAMLRAASGEAGEQMLAQGHRLKVGGDSMIGQCIADHQPCIALDVGQEAVRFDNPLLPETHSEMALPLITREGAVGALSIQSRERGAFGAEEIAVFETLAGQLANAIANARLYEMLKDENLRMSAELAVTQRLQQMLLPTEEELRQIEELDIAGFMEPAEEVGGDYYDVLNHDGQIKIGIGDVTGHGLESGVVMLMLQTAVRTLMTSDEQDPVRFLSILNRLLHENMQRMQVSKSMTLALLDYQIGQMHVSGQHEQVIVVRKGGQVELKDTTDLGFPLGLVSGVAEFVHEVPIDLQPGDGVVLYSDGITEAGSEGGEFYGLERLCGVVSAAWGGSAEGVKDAVVADVKAFIGNQKVYDDITLVVVKQR